ncbi:hypothetical protein BDP67DRAFT_90952 [Colletotrichum lupini]|nr:hypothetical protein BDP67DRAFT_90952 [Colletotrichum lupini]
MRKRVNVLFSFLVSRSFSCWFLYDGTVMQTSCMNSPTFDPVDWEPVWTITFRPSNVSNNQCSLNTFFASHRTWKPRDGQGLRGEVGNEFKKKNAGRILWLVGPARPGVGEIPVNR